MKIASKLFLFFLLMISPLIISIPSYATDVYIVQPIILIPKDWKDRESAEGIQSYKQVIVSNLGSAQQFFATRLNGKSFNFANTVEVVYSDKEVFNTSGEIEKVFDYLNILDSTGKQLIPYQLNKIQAIWIIGSNTSGKAYAFANSVGRLDTSLVVMPYVDLFNARGDLGFDAKQWSKYALAHELGHAFGLNYSGYGKGHPCTEVSTGECIDGTPQPLPPAQEWTSVMGYGTPFTEFPNIRFNNTFANPEITKLYKSPFINSENDPAPEPTVDSGVKAPTVFRLGSEQIVQAGTVYNLFNGDKLFGEKPGKIEFISTVDKTTTLPPDSYEVKNWNGIGIGIFIKDNAVSPAAQSRWTMQVTTADGALFQADKDFIIQGKDFNKPALILTVTLLAACGAEKKPLAAEFNLFGGPDPNKLIGTSTFTDKLTGKGEISLGINNPVVGTQYQLDGRSVSGVGHIIETYTLNAQDIQAGEKIGNVQFFDPSCPAAADSQSTPSPIPSGSIMPVPSGTVEPSPTNTPASICPAAADNCVYSQGDKCYSGYTSDTSTCTWINDTCLNPTAGCAYSCGPLVSCPTSASTKPTPIPSSSAEPTPTSTPIVTPLATPFSSSEPTPTSVSESTQVLISNYVDFRSDNAPTDAGSPTVAINNPSGQTITWKLSTLVPSPTRRVFVRVITGEEYKDYEPLEMRDGEMVTVAGINIQAKMVKKVVRLTVTVNGQDQEIDINNPQEIITRLPGNAGQAQRFSLPFVIEYSDGEVVYSALLINYQPQSDAQATPLVSASLVQPSSGVPQPTAEPFVSSAPGCGDFTFKYNECFACNQSRRVLQDSCGRFDNTEVNPGTDPACESWCSSSPSPEVSKKIVRVTVNEQEIDPTELYSGFRLDLPGVAGQPQVFSIPVVVYYSDGSSRPLAYTFKYQPQSSVAPGCTEIRQYNECTACNTSRRISQDSCGNYTPIVESQYDEGCASWCPIPEQSTEPALEQCPEDRSDQYPQCGGTVGLEDKDPAHTYLITRVKDCQGNTLRYEQEDLGDQGQCQN